MRSAPFARRSSSATSSTSSGSRRGSASTPAPVVAGEGDTLVTGDAVNVAARLEQAAGAGEVLLGDETLAARAGRGGDGAGRPRAEGKDGTGAGASSRARSTRPPPGSRGAWDAAWSGRVREREKLRADFADVAAGRTCRLFTLIGPAGIGKSRLVADFLERSRDAAHVAQGHALSYGEGITYWPLVETARPARESTRGGDPLVAGRHAAGDPGAARAEGRRGATRARRRRPSVGGATHARSCGAHRRLVARRADPPALHRPAGAARREAELGGREAERDVDPAGAARGERGGSAGRRSPGHRRARHLDAGAYRRRRRRAIRCSWRR